MTSIMIQDSREMMTSQMTLKLINDDQSLRVMSEEIVCPLARSKLDQAKECPLLLENPISSLKLTPKHNKDMSV